MNDCALTNFDLTKLDLDITMHPQDQIPTDQIPTTQSPTDQSPTDPKYVCFEKLDIVMDDNKRTTYSVVPIGSEKTVEDAILEPSQKPKIHYAKMLPYINYPSNSLLLKINTYP